MELMHMDSDFFVPFLIFSIPIIAIAGGITAGIVRTLGNQRLIEMAQRERIAAIEHGIDPAKLPPIPLHQNADDVANPYLSAAEHAHRRSTNLMTGGVITLFVGIGVAIFLWIVDKNDNAWGVGIVPIAAGLGLLLSAWLIRARGPGPTA